MQGAYRAHRLTFLLLLAAAAPARAEGLQGYVQHDFFPLEYAEPTVEWKATWQETFQANTTRWKKEIDSQTQLPEDSREWRMKLRTARLLEKLVERFPNEIEKRIAAYGEIAYTYRSIYTTHVRLNYIGRGNYFYKKLAEEFPGRVDLATSALSDILSRTSTSTAEGAQWIAYASDRLIALGDAGCIDEDEPALASAWYARARLRRYQRRFVEAWAALDKARQLGAGEARCLVERADLLLDAGRWVEALALYKEVQPVAGDSTSHVNARIDDLSQPQDISQADFPRDVPLEAQWEAMLQRKEGAPADVIHPTILEAAVSKGAADWGDGRQRSLWSAIDSLMLQQKAPFLTSLRGVQSAAARPAAQAARRDGGDADGAIVALYRRYPWSDEVHEAMLAAGERQLRLGQAGLARRAFQDVLAHAAGREARSRAQVGLWLAAGTLADDAADLLPLFQGIDEKDTFPWMGSTKPAAFIKQRLLDSLKTAAPPSAGDGELTVRPLTAPPLTPADRLRVDSNRLQLGALMASDLCRLRTIGDRTFVIGPSVLACFGADPSRPLWARTARLPRKVRRAERYYFDTLQRFRPAFADGRLFCRWGLDDAGRNVAGLAAFDADTGEMLWSAEDSIFAVSDPVAADGRLYALAIDAGADSFSDLHLVCLAGDTGRLLWRKTVVSQEIRRWGVESPDRKDEWGPILYEGSLVASGGAVYCQSNLGFVARFDARDGLLEWRVQYPRTYVWRERRDVLRRRGHVPVAVGGSVVFLPQDYAGLFAVDALTGRMVWDNALAPCEELADVAGGLLLTIDTHNLAAVDAAKGEVLWTRHFAEGINGQPAAAGKFVYAAAGGELLRLDLRTGQAVEAAHLPAEKVVANLAVRGDSLLTVPAIARETPASAPPAPTGALHPPLKEAWRLPRRSPALLIPPAGANLPGRLYVLSNDVLECVRTDTPGVVEWQRPVEPDWDSMEWLDRGLLFVYPRHVTSIDAASGAVRWATRSPFAIDYSLFRPPYLIIRDIGYRWASKSIAVIDTTTGRVLWRRGFDSTFNYCLNGEIGFDGKLLYLFGTTTEESDRCVQLALRPADGRIMDISPLDIDTRNQPRQVALGEGFGYLRLADGRIRQFAFGKREVVDRRQLSREGPGEGETQFDIRGPWLRLLWPWWRGGHAVVLKHGEPAYEYTGPGRQIDGETLYQYAREAVTAIDLPTRKQTVYRLVGDSAAGDDDDAARQQVIDVARDGPALAVLSAVRRRSFDLAPLVLHVDLFDAGSATPLGGRDLTDVRFANWRGGDGRTRHNELVLAGPTLIVSDPEGLTAFVRDRDGAEPRPPPRVVHRMGRPATIDGSLDDWAGQDGFAMVPADSRQGRVWLAHDARNLYVAVSYGDARVLSRKGRPRCGGGDWVELGLTAGHYSWRLALGADERGEPSVELLEHPDGLSRIPDGLIASVGQDLAAGRVVYELAVPIQGLARTDQPMSEIGVSAVVWSESQVGLGQVRALTWGGALTSAVTEPARHECVRLHPLDPRGHRGALAVAEALPDLTQSLELLRSDIEITGAGGDEAAEACWAFVQRHPATASAEALLAAIYQQTPAPTAAAAEKLLARAAKAGVPQAVLQRLRWQASAYLSQWVYLQEPGPATSILIRLSDGDGWQHGAVWGQPHAFDWAARDKPLACCHAGPLPPGGLWHELRIGLLWIGMHDRPITGVSFRQRGEGDVFWDRTSLVAGGRSRALIDGAEPDGKLEGKWTWVTQPARGAARTHTGRAPGARGEISHDVSDMPQPVVDHLATAPDRPYLSQWVLLDPANPPQAVEIRLGDGREWRCRARWGPPVREALCRGPMPPAGRWQELRLPLTGTAFQDRPILAIGFGQLKGQAVWDRTAAVVGGRETVVIDDDPAGVTEGDWRWVDQPVKSGAKAHTIAPPSGMAWHDTRLLKTPLAAHLPFDPVRAAGVLTRYIPDLGPTQLALDLLNKLLALESADAKGRIARYRWFLAAIPDHPKAVDLLGALLTNYREISDPNAVASVDTLLAACPFDEETVYQYNRRFVSDQSLIVPAWQLIGTFGQADGGGLDTVYPPETDGAELNRAYEDGADVLKWRPLPSPRGRVSVRDAFDRSQRGVAYTACWLSSPRAQPALLEVRCDSPWQVWLNRKPLSGRTSRQRRDYELIPIGLAAGSNELMVKSLNSGRRSSWYFTVRLIEAHGRGAPPGVTATATPPPLVP